MNDEKRADGGAVLSSAELGGNAEALRRDHGGNAARRKLLDLPVGHRIISWEQTGAKNVRYSFAAFERDLFGDGPVWGAVTHTTTVTPAEMCAEFWRVEREDGECGACIRGVEWSGWSHVAGNRFTTCARCGGTALPPNVGAERQ